MLKTKAFVVKRPAEGGFTPADGAPPRVLGQVSWKKSGGPGVAWEKAKQNAGWIHDD